MIQHFQNLEQHKFLRWRSEDKNLLLDVVGDSRKRVNKRFEKYYQIASQDPGEFEKIIYNQVCQFPQNGLMSPVVLSVTTNSNASSSIVSNHSVKRIQIFENLATNSIEKSPFP